MADPTLSEVPVGPEPLCEWIEPALRELAGQDPLGLQTITTDRILPGLLPGVLALSVRARYFSIYSFLVRRYSQNGGRADNTGLDEFMRQREFELCIAANLCPHCDAESVIGNLRGRPLVATNPAVYERNSSIKTELGGYGLYYRTPMEELGLIARRGSALIGDEPIPVDVLHKTPRAQDIADLFEEAVADTRWYRDYMHGVDAIPAEVFEELAESGCLCRLAAHPAERAALGEMFLTAPTPEREKASDQRRRAFALLLDLGERESDAVVSDAAFRDGAISTFLADPSASGVAADTRARWAAVAMRECLQDPLASIWVSFCRAGLAKQPFEGLTRDELAQLVGHDLIGGGEVILNGQSVGCTADTPASGWLEDLHAATESIGWEAIRATAHDSPDALTGLACFLILCSRVSDVAGESRPWGEVALVDGERQPGLGNIAARVQRQLAADPPVAEVMRWVVDNFIVSVHETVAMAKLPESTFRFFWEHGRLRFVDNGVWRFDVSGLRRDALASLSFDLGWWEWDAEEVPAVTADGREVIARVFAS